MPARAPRSGTDNERLEFLGDRVLGLVVAEHALRDLSRGRARASCRSGSTRWSTPRRLRPISDEIGLPALIRAGIAMLTAPARQARQNLRADAVEALIAAIYLEAGWTPARNFIARYWEPRSQRRQRRPARSQDRIAGMGASGRRRASRSIMIESREGPDHDPVFTVSVELTGFEPATGSGRSKRAGRAGGGVGDSCCAKASGRTGRTERMTEDEPARPPVPASSP